MPCRPLIAGKPIQRVLDTLEAYCNLRHMWLVYQEVDGSWAASSSTILRQSQAFSKTLLALSGNLVIQSSRALPQAAFSMYFLGLCFLSWREFRVPKHVWETVLLIHTSEHDILPQCTILTTILSSRVLDSAEYYTTIEHEVSDKANAGFNTSVTDYWGRGTCTRSHHSLS